MNLPQLSLTSVSDLSPEDLDLEVVLEAWHTATTRLQHTHENLCDEVRRLTEELEVKNRELARKNRLADLGQMASHVAHEVRNCLMPLTLYMSLLRRSVDPTSDNLEIVDKIESGFTALEATVNDLLHFTANRDPAWRPCYVRNVVAEVCESLGPQIDAQNIRTELDIPAGEVILADTEMVRRAVLNLVLNALDAMPEGGELVFTSVVTSRGYELEVGDSGPGIDEETQRRLFEPFFTTKSGGTGLGLAIVYRIAEVHGGDVTCQNCPEGGAAFTLRIPRRAMEAAA